MGPAGWTPMKAMTVLSKTAGGYFVTASRHRCADMKTTVPGAKNGDRGRSIKIVARKILCYPASKFDKSCTGAWL